MDTLHYLINFVLHIDQHLASFIGAYGVFVYILLFAIIFCETGVILLAFLPGDSLLFAVGAYTANSPDILNIHLLFFSLLIASVSGNGLSYFTGKWLGPKVFRSRHSWLFNQKYLDQAHAFYERFGGKTIIIARFMPIIRTFAPFIAGIGYMTYRQFFFYNFVGGVLWIGMLLYGSFWFGNIPFVHQHFSIVVLAIIGLSILPPVIEIIRQKFTTTPAFDIKK
jgi:membrane-associated protein